MVMSSNTTLYRFFDASDNLLYVGITHRLNSRLSEHKRNKPWREVASVTLEHHPTREAAVAAEIAAIQNEAPAWNVLHAAPSGPPAHRFQAEYPQGVVGHFFHSFTVEDDGCKLPQWQGQVVGQIADNLFLVETFEWLMGEPYSRQIVDVEEMADWTFYEDDEWMRFNYDQYLSRRRERHEQHEVVPA